jgi:hypothetical protein
MSGTQSAAAPSAASSFVGSLSRAELALLGGGALILLLELIGWFVGGFGLSLVIVGAAGVLVAMVLLRGSLPGSISGSYAPLLFAFGVLAVIPGADVFVRGLLDIARTGGVGVEYLLNWLGLGAAVVAIAFGVYLLLRGRG